MELLLLFVFRAFSGEIGSLTGIQVMPFAPSPLALLDLATLGFSYLDNKVPNP